MVKLPLMKALEVKNISFSYQEDKLTLSDITFDINEGEYISVVGPNGSGKSTLARVLVGLLPHKSGEISILGEELTKKSLISIRKKIGMIFQNPDNQFIGATVEDDIAFGLENRRIARDDMKRIVYEFATKVGMIDYLNKEPSTLSGGQKQRVAIASMLSLNPDILIMDEATSMLDPSGRKEINALIDEIRKEKPSLTIISITHDVEEASKSNRVLLLVDGKVSKFDKPEIVFKNADELRNAHLSVPFFFELKDKLFENDIDIEKDDELKSARDNLCQ